MAQLAMISNKNGEKATTLVAGTSSRGERSLPGGRRSSPATTGISAIS